MNMTSAYQEVGTLRGAAAMCGCDPKTIKRALARAAAGDEPAERSERARNYDVVVDVVRARVSKTSGRISAKRLLTEARAAGYTSRTPLRPTFAVVPRPSSTASSTGATAR
jgi:hypothetical protein